MLDLTPKQEAFAQAYLETGNASEAYRRAYNAEGMKEKSIHENASKLLNHAKVAPRLAELQAASAKKHEITIGRLTEMTLAAFTEAQRISPASGQMQTASMIKAAEFLGKLHGLVVDKSEISGKDGAPIVPVLNVSVGRNQSEPAS